jgi:hypothetical protein
MDYTVPIAQVMQHVRDVLILRASEHINLNTETAQAAGQFTDIDVHTTGIFST